MLSVNFLPPSATMSRQYVVYFFYYLPFILEKDYKHKSKSKSKRKRKRKGKA